MKLYLLRHAEAVDQAESDSARALTPKGWKQAERVGRFCAKHLIVWNRVLTSPFVRTVETAAGALAQIKNPPTPEATDWLASGAEPATILGELSRLRDVESLLLVGHEPDLSQLAGHLIGADAAGPIRVRKASLLLLEVASFRRGAATLAWLAPVKFME